MNQSNEIPATSQAEPVDQSDIETVALPRPVDYPMWMADSRPLLAEIASLSAKVTALEAAVRAWDAWLTARIPHRAEHELVVAAVAQKKAMAVISEVKL